MLTRLLPTTAVDAAHAAVDACAMSRCTTRARARGGRRRCPRGRRRGCRRPSTLPTWPSTRLSTLPTRPSTLPTPDVMACNRRAWRRPCASPWDEHCWIELRRLIMSPCPRASLSAITTPRSLRRRRSLEGNERVRPGHEPRHDRDAPCTRHDRDAPCTRFSCILWPAWCVCVLSCRLCVLLCLVALGAVAPVPLEALRGFVSRGGKAYFGKLAPMTGPSLRRGP